MSPCHLGKILLAVLFLGPLVAPLFQATGLPLVADSGALARDLLSTYVCPTPAKSYALFGFPMAVCARCWGAAIGLSLAWLLHRPPTTDHRPPTADHRPPTTEDGGWRVSPSPLRPFTPSSYLSLSLSLIRRLIAGFLALPWPLRLGLAVSAFLLWPLEIQGWAAAPRWLLLLNGADAGFWGALFLGSIWPGRR